METAQRIASEQGLQQGLEQGLEQGREEGVLRVARGMLPKGMAIAVVCECTGLPGKMV